MKFWVISFRLSRLLALALSTVLLVVAQAHAQTDPLPSWNDGSAKQAIIQFAKDATEKSGPKFVYRAGKPVLMRLPKVFFGKRPYAAFGNSDGDREMLEWTTASDGARLAMLVLHHDADREYAYGPAAGLPDTKVGTFTLALCDEAKKKDWIVIGMKKDWKVIFPFETK